jgi:hypothetical protein
VDHGILGAEPTYRGVAELTEDVAITRAAGIEHIVAFSLGGILRRKPAEAWLDALVYTEPAAELPPLTARARALAIGLSAASHGMHWSARLRRAASQRGIG